jgi:hypothetical protein
MKSSIVDIANTYMSEHDGELPLLIVVHKENETRIIRGHFREKHAQADQATFVNVMRLAMIIYGYTSYEFIAKPEFNYQALQMTKDVWAVGQVTPHIQKSEFFVIEDDKLVPYFGEMPIGGFIAQLLPSEEERQMEFKPAVLKQIRLYIENSTYHLPIKQEAEVVETDAFESLFSLYETA